MTAPDTFSPTALLFSRKAVLAWSFLVAALIGTLYGALQVKETIDHQTRDEISFASDQVTARVHDRLDEYGLILRGAAGLFTGSEQVDRVEWKRFVDELDAAHIVPGVQGVGYAVLIPPGQLAAHTATVRAEGFSDYEVHPAGTRSVYTSVVFLEPFSGRNLRAFGYDMYSEPTRRAAMDVARDTGSAALSGRVTLVQETDSDVQAGVLMYVAVYRSDMPTRTIDERRAALIGWVYSPYRMNDLMSGLLDGWETPQGRYLDLHIDQGDGTTPRDRLYDSDRGLVGGGASGFAQHRTIDFNGQQWTLHFDRLATAPPIDHGAVWWTLAGGALLSVLLFLLVLSLRTTRENATILARQTTRELLDREQALKSSEQRWKFAVEGAGDGLWDWNIPAGTVYYSRVWKSMLGYDDDEIGTSLDEWTLRIHPDDAASTLTTIQKYLAGKATEYVNEHRMRCKDGTYLWVLDRGTVIERDEAAAPLRMIGTHKDITERREAEGRIERYARQLERTFIETVALTTTLSEKRDPYTAGHEQRVAELAVAIGERLGLDHDRIEGLRVGGYLHDVGKISVPTEILVKPSRLTAIEESMVREHPRVGFDILKEVEFPWPVAQIALQHHERLDGSGYPDGLKGDQIILEARIVAVADVVESMANHRPYRAALGLEAALAEVERGAGTLYDAQVVRTCVRLVRDEGFWAETTTPDPVAGSVHVA